MSFPSYNPINHLFPSSLLTLHWHTVALLLTPPHSQCLILLDTTQPLFPMPTLPLPFLIPTCNSASLDGPSTENPMHTRKILYNLPTAFSSIWRLPSTPPPLDLALSHPTNRSLPSSPPHRPFPLIIPLFPGRPIDTLKMPQNKLLQVLSRIPQPPFKQAMSCFYASVTSILLTRLLANPI